MKSVLSLLVVAITLISCSTNPAKYHVPAGYQTCRFTADCPIGTRCAFIEPDSYAVCTRR